MWGFKFWQWGFSGVLTRTVGGRCGRRRSNPWTGITKHAPRSMTCRNILSVKVTVDGLLYVICDVKLIPLSILSLPFDKSANELFFELRQQRMFFLCRRWHSQALWIGNFVQCAISEYAVFILYIHSMFSFIIKQNEPLDPLN